MYVSQKEKAYPFCLGCSHVQVLDAINKALTKIDADPRKTVMVSDIGCVGLVDSYFKLHTFHGLHGRSFTYACGLKLANPDLNVFVMVGDGGCGIGGHHLINAARRNIGINVIIFNNFNFGMTGGQHSVTSPLLSKTKTTPAGNIERGFDLAKLTIAAGAPYVARKLAFDKDLADTMAEAMKHKGFSVMDVWEICTAYFMPMNDFKKPAMEMEIDRSGMNLGVFQKEEVPEYSHHVKKFDAEAAAKLTKPRGIQKKFDHSLKKDSFSVILAGSAGMKIVSCAGNLGNAALKSGLHVAQKDDFPITVATGHSVSELKFSPREIEYLGVDNPDVVVVISEDGLGKTKEIIEKLPKEALVIATKELRFKTKAKVIEIDSKAAGMGRKSLATVASAILLNKTGFMSLDSFKDAISEIRKEPIRNENLKAIEMAGSF